MKTSSLQFKVLLIAAGAMLFAASVAIISLSRVYGEVQDLDRISREDFQVQQQLLRAQIAFQKQAREWRSVLLSGRDTNAIDRAWGDFQKLEKETQDLLREARSGASNEEVRSKVEAFIAAHRQAGEAYRAGLAEYKGGFDTTAGDRVVDAAAVVRTLDEALQKADDATNKDVMEAVTTAERVYRISIAAIAIAMLAACIGLWLFMRKAVLAPLSNAVQFAEHISKGDLTVDIHS